MEKQRNRQRERQTDRKIGGNSEDNINLIFSNRRTSVIPTVSVYLSVCLCGRLSLCTFKELLCNKALIINSKFQMLGAEHQFIHEHHRKSKLCRVHQRRKIQAQLSGTTERRKRSSYGGVAEDENACHAKDSMNCDGNS